MMTARAVVQKASLVSACLIAAGCGGGVFNAVTGPTLPAPSAVSNGPQLGYVWDAASQTLRPILGLPGSSQGGQPVTTAGAYVFGAASAKSSIALLEAADGSLSEMALPAGAAAPIAGVKVAAGAVIAFSPSGQNAIVYAKGASSVTLLTGLSSTVQVQPIAAPSALVAAAVSDTAQVAAVAGSGPLSLNALTGGKGVLTSLASYGGMNFLPGGSDLLAADASSGAVMLIRNSASSPALQTFNASAISAPVAVAASGDGHWAVVANGGDASVVRIDLSGGTAALRIACACQPTELATFTGNAVFRVTTVSTGPVWMVDASAATPQALFIPAMVKP
ncbi:MAG: hypothetical protein V4555_00920 [Acidobacteriota bacterium]